MSIKYPSTRILSNILIVSLLFMHLNMAEIILAQPSSNIVNSCIRPINIDEVQWVQARFINRSNIPVVTIVAQNATKIEQRQQNIPQTDNRASQILILPAASQNQYATKINNIQSYGQLTLLDLANMLGQTEEQKQWILKNGDQKQLKQAQQAAIIGSKNAPKSQAVMMTKSQQKQFDQEINDYFTDFDKRLGGVSTASQQNLSAPRVTSSTVQNSDFSRNFDRSRMEADMNQIFDRAFRN